MRSPFAGLLFTYKAVPLPTGTPFFVQAKPGLVPAFTRETVYTASFPGQTSTSTAATEMETLMTGVTLMVMVLLVASAAVTHPSDVFMMQ